MREITEAVTANEALRRVGCAELRREYYYDQVFVDWTGHPVAFDCGKTRTRKDRVERVSEDFCYGNVLYSWACVSAPDITPRVHLNTRFCVCVDRLEPSDGGEIVLVAGERRHAAIEQTAAESPSSGALNDDDTAALTAEVRLAEVEARAVVRGTAQAWSERDRRLLYAGAQVVWTCTPPAGYGFTVKVLAEVVASPKPGAKRVRIRLRTGEIKSVSLAKVRLDL